MTGGFERDDRQPAVRVRVRAVGSVPAAAGHLPLTGDPGQKRSCSTCCPSVGLRAAHALAFAGEAIAAWLPLFLFMILFGLSMDYHVFILTRIREAFDRGMTAEDAVAHGIKSTAGVVTSAAIVMVAVFSNLQRRCPRSCRCSSWASASRPRS